jgi:hypothetical protein
MMELQLKECNKKEAPSFYLEIVSNTNRRLLLKTNRIMPAAGIRAAFNAFRRNRRKFLSDQ